MTFSRSGDEGDVDHVLWKRVIDEDCVCDGMETCKVEVLSAKVGVLSAVTVMEPRGLLVLVFSQVVEIVGLC